MDILFSVIVPIYKVPYGLLRKSIESILNQSYSNLEIILIDDGSPDDCGKICEDFRSKDSRVKVVHQKNGGLSVVRNTGINIATGEWVSFVDGDDWIESNTYEIAKKIVTTVNDDVDVIAWDGYADFGTVSKQINFFGSNVKVKKCRSSIEMIDTMLPIYHITSYRLAVFDVTWARMYRRDVLVRNNLQNVPGLKRAQDLIFNLEVFEYAKGLYYENIPLYHYSMHDEAVTKKYDTEIASKMIQFSEALKGYVYKYRNNQEFYQRMYVKIMPKIVECFTQYYIILWKNEGLMKSLFVIKKELMAMIFREAVENMDGSGNIRKMKIFQYLLKHRLYLLLLVICRMNNFMKNKKMKG